MIKINNVIADSPADKCGIIKGDFLIKINQHEIKDVLDYMFYAAEINPIIEILRGCKL